MRLIDAEPIEKYIEDGLNCKDPKKRFGHDAIEILTEVHYAPTITPPPNDPLTLEQLREMVGNPVYIERYDGGPSRWAIVGDFESLYGIYFGTAQGGLRLPYDFSGKTWLAYRRKPEEGTT